MFSLNTIGRYLDAKRQTTNKRGRGRRQAPVVLVPQFDCTQRRESPNFSTTTRPTAGVLIALLIRATLPSSVHVTTLRVATPNAHASQLTWWKRLRMRRRSGRLTPRMSQPPRSDTRPLETHLRTPASYLVTSVASLARKLSARPSLSRNGQSGDGDFEAISPAVWHP